MALPAKFAAIPFDPNTGRLPKNKATAALVSGAASSRVSSRSRSALRLDNWSQPTGSSSSVRATVSAGLPGQVVVERFGQMQLDIAVTVHEERLPQPLQRRKPTVYFVNSMSDLFDAPGMGAGGPRSV